MSFWIWERGATMSIDPITVEIIKDALKAAGREMGLLVERASMWAFIREKKDFFVGIYDDNGNLMYTDHGKFGMAMLDSVRFEFIGPSSNFLLTALAALLTRKFQEAVRSGKMPYAIVDSHWSPDGHALVASRLSAELHRRGWLETVPKRLSCREPSQMLALLESYH
jgi:hypothetical protein